MLPSSPSSLLGDGWSYPDFPEDFVGSGLSPHSSLSVPCLFSGAPNDLHPSVLASAVSPQEQDILFRYADSIFDEKPLEDEPEADATWDDNQSTSDLPLITVVKWSLPCCSRTWSTPND
jgi:hypothetical protein